MDPEEEHKGGDEEEEEAEEEEEEDEEEDEEEEVVEEEEEEFGGYEDVVLVKRIDKIFNQVAQNMEKHELMKLITILKEAVDMHPEDPDEMVESLIDKFTALTLYRRGISVNLIKQAVRSLIEMKLDVELASMIWDKITSFNRKALFSFMAEFGELDEETMKKYLELLRQGSENVRHIRLMVVGMFGVGKTTIIQNICKKSVEDVKSTVGIDVSVNACEVTDNKEWKVTDLEAKKTSLKYIKQRLADAFKQANNPNKGFQRMAPERQPRAEAMQEEYTDENEAEFDEDVESYTEEVTEYHRPDKQSQPRKTRLKARKPGKDWKIPRIKPENIIRNIKKKHPKTKALFDDMKDLAYDEKKPVQLHKRLTTVSIWDFAGQSIYYSTHHFFLSSRAIYLLVLNISQDLDQPVPEDCLGSGGLDRATSMPKGFTCRDAFKFWMNSIYTYTNKDSTQHYKPTIVLVGTFKDIVKKKYQKDGKMTTENCLEDYKENYFDKALEAFNKTELIHLVHKKKFFVSKNDPAEIFDALKEELYNIAEKQPFWNEIKPLKWMPLERSIEIRKEDTKTNSGETNAGLDVKTERKDSDKTAEAKTESQDADANQASERNTAESEHEDTKRNNFIMEFKELEKIDKETEYPLSDKGQMQLFLQFQHLLGNVLYYKTELLENNIILDPQWILNVFKLFVAHVREKEPTLLDHWDNYTQNGILSLPLINELIDHSKDETFIQNRGTIIQYMEHLDVIAKPVLYSATEVEDSSSDEEETQTNKDGEKPLINKTEDFYIVPCLLSLKPPKDHPRCKVPDNAKSTPILSLVFKNKFLPAFVCHRLMATCIRKWEVAHYDTKQLMVFNGMGRFLLNPGKNMWLTLWWKEHIIYMQIFLCTNKQKPVCGRKCKKVRQHVQEMIREIFSIHRHSPGEVWKYSQTVQYDEYIKCPECVKGEAGNQTNAQGTEEADDFHGSEMNKMLSVKIFENAEEVNCDNLHTTSRDAALSQWFYQKNEDHKLERLATLRKEMFDWFQQNKDETVVSDRHISELSKNIGKEYIAVGIELGLRYVAIQQMETEKDIETRIKNILSKWKGACTTEPTVLVIKTAILNVFGIYVTTSNKYKYKKIDHKEIVRWFESEERMNYGNEEDADEDDVLDVDGPTERDFLDITHFVNMKYKRLRKHLGLKYLDIEKIEEMYSLDFNRTLAVLLKWKQKGENVSYSTLRKIVEKLLKMDWDAVKGQITEDEKKGSADGHEEEDHSDDELDCEDGMERRRGMMQGHGIGVGEECVPGVDEEATGGKVIYLRDQMERRHRDSDVDDVDYQSIGSGGSGRGSGGDDNV